MMRISRLKSTSDSKYISSFLPQGFVPCGTFYQAGNLCAVVSGRIVEHDEIFVNIGVKIDFVKAIIYNILDCHIGGE